MHLMKVVGREWKSKVGRGGGGRKAPAPRGGAAPVLQTAAETKNRTLAIYAVYINQRQPLLFYIRLYHKVFLMAR
jgi:hypothetical protein